MSYLALYRKFRPDSFDEVKGQEHVVTTLKNQIANNRVGHAYLLCGTRGTGKTTIAKLMAKTMNCENPTDSGPCGVCESCRAIADGSSLNVVEIDAATHNGVDNIRQINEAVQYAPAQGKYLVYIIDEAHQLSKGAYNALLKTLEEPPEYVIFILATTDDFSLPVTIKSRCQRFDFHRISVDTIADRMREIVDREGIAVTDDALSYIARLADGSMRDGLSILDECISASIGKELDRDDVLSIVGAVSLDIYIDMFRAITDRAPEKALEIIERTIWDGKDLTKFADDFAWFVRNILFLKLAPDIGDELDATRENIELMQRLGQDYSVDKLSSYLSTLQELCSDIRKSSVKRVTLEMTIIKLMYDEAGTDIASLVARVDKLERGAGAGEQSGGPQMEAPDAREIEALVDAKVDRELSRRIADALRDIKALDAENSASVESFDKAEQSDIVIENIRNDYPEPEREDIMRLADNWKNIRKQLNPLHQRYTKKLDVEPAQDYEAGEEAHLVAVLYEEEEGSLTNNYINNPKTRDFLADELSEIIKKRVTIDVRKVKGRRGALDRTSHAINRINYDVTILESEEERNG